MILISKRVGETPLETLERVRIEKPEMKDEVLSYAGRLDPMAEGEMLVLVGDENNHREDFLSCDKEYVATFLIGVATDTYDALGIIDHEGESAVSKERITASLEKIRALREQTYPWFSGHTVDGVKLFDHYKNGNMGIVRPMLPVEIKEAILIGRETVQAKEVVEYIKDSIGKIHGDFRQEKILAGWKTYFEKHTANMQIFTVRFRVSSGAYIRAFTEQFDFPAILLKLKRTKICISEDRKDI
ncbi:MAG: hypothetical protein NUV53_02605 [Patescibacteria group bacterium]|nr:hypothetical protein [Patescibacteria group bacterium]